MSPARTFCAHYDQGRCRSCGWIGQSHPDQLKKKEALIRRELAFLGDLPLEAPVASESLGFRDRVKMSVTGTLTRPVIGLTGAESLDEGRELLDCPIHHPRLNELVSSLPEIITRHRLVPYRIRERQGELKGLIAYRSPVSGEMYLRFVVRSRKSLPRLKDAAFELQRAFPDLACASANLQPVPHAVLEGREEIFLTDRKWIRHPLQAGGGEIELRLSPQAFVQTNSRVATALYRCAAEWIASSRASRMLELFCGQGLFSFFAAGAVKEALGIEINADAVETAREAASRLGLAHLRFAQADAARVDDEIKRFAPDLILVNPPRRGLVDLGFLERGLPRHFLYSSCSLESLAADLKKLPGGYRVQRARLFDMFPHTEHFETLIWLSREEKTSP